MTGKVFFITGIDTNIGKSYATGYIAKTYSAAGFRVVTQKLIPGKIIPFCAAE
jgi:dethiobiotin synthetase